MKSTRRLPHGGLATVMEYDMEEFLSSCLDKFKELAHVKDIRPFPTPFITEEHTSAPQVQAGTGPCVECPWCKHTFPPNVHETVNALERDIQKQKAKLKNLESPSKDSHGNAESSSSRGSHPAESTGKLASIASRILMKVLWAARLARFDLLRAVCHLAHNVTKWTSECDRKLTRLMGYIEHSKGFRLVGWVGDKLDKCQPHLYVDADFAGCTETQRSTSGLHFVCMGPNTNFPITGVSKRQGCVSHSTPEAEIVATAFALRMVGIPSLQLWHTLSPASPNTTHT